jgi:hypothetical protein
MIHLRDGTIKIDGTGRRQRFVNQTSDYAKMAHSRRPALSRGNFMVAHLQQAIILGTAMASPQLLRPHQSPA